MLSTPCQGIVTWNLTVEANDAVDAAEQTVAGFDPERVDGVEVERA